MSTAPSPFSKVNPKLQLAWDATSLRALQFCPTFYRYSILEGWTGSTVDLEFGIIVHKGVEAYYRARLRGLNKEDATLEALDETLEVSGRRDEEGAFTPWGGRYAVQWHCTGTEPYKNKKGNRAKCPFSHKGAWFEGEGPATCGECGSPTEYLRQWVPEDAAKNRNTAVRLVAWYCDDQPEDLEEGLQPYAFPNGTPAVELPIRLPLPFKARTGETFMLAGYLDRLARLGGEHFIADVKTTKKPITSNFFEGWTPNAQMDQYDLMGALAFPDLKLKGIVLDVAQTLVGGAKFGRGVLRRTEAQREELLEDIEYWVGQAEKFAEEGRWPRNRANCTICPFKKICAKDPSTREGWLAADFHKRFWNPLEER